MFSKQMVRFASLRSAILIGSALVSAGAIHAQAFADLKSAMVDYSKADLESRREWTKAVLTEAERRDFTTCYWEFGAGFGLYDPVKNEWRTPLLESFGLNASKPRP